MFIILLFGHLRNAVELIKMYKMLGGELLAFVFDQVEFVLGFGTIFQFGKTKNSNKMGISELPMSGLKNVQTLSVF